MSEFDCKISNYDFSTSFFSDTTTTLTKAQKRWRLAYWTICSFLAYASEARTRRLSDVLHNNPYFALNIEPSTSRYDVKKVVSTFIDPDVNATKLTEVVKNKDLHTFNRECGGVEGVATALGATLENGISGSDEGIRTNALVLILTISHLQKFLYFVLEAFKDSSILILLVCAALALGFGIKEHGVGEGWYEGGIIFVAVFLVVFVSALSNFRQERQYDKLSKLNSNIKVEVVRDGRRQQLSIFDLMVGDVVFLKIGDQIPADGLFLDGYSLQVDESSMKGESEHVEVDSTKNPFLFSGSNVADGYAQMLVVSVGMNTAWGEMMSSISSDSNERTALQPGLTN